MYNIKYGVGLNENGRPCIELSEDYEQRPEDRFFALEITRYMLLDLLNRNNDKLDVTTVNVIEDAEKLIGQLGDEVARILYDGMRAQAELELMMDKNFHIEVSSIEIRDALPEKDILFMDKLFDRVEGLKVGIRCYDEKTYERYFIVYELVDGITNDHWKLHLTQQVFKDQPEEVTLAVVDYDGTLRFGKNPRNVRYTYNSEIWRGFDEVSDEGVSIYKPLTKINRT